MGSRGGSPACPEFGMEAATGSATHRSPRENVRMAKQLAFDSEAREALSTGVSHLARAVRATLGPRGRNAMLDKGWGAPTVTKDGVSVAEEIEFADPYQNMGARLLREVASKTSDVAGDGTTTATVLAEALYREGLKHVVAGANPIDVQRGLLHGCGLVV